MRQIARRLRDGRRELVDVPDPAPAPGMVSVRVAASLVSSGTERAPSTSPARASSRGASPSRSGTSG